MGNTQNFIEINGKKYDAVTGVMLDSSLQKPVVRASVSSVSPVVDGFTRRHKDASVTRQDIVSHGVKKHVIAPQKSKTLMRSVVKKPTEPLHSDTVHSEKVPSKTLFGKAVITPRAQTTPEHRQHRAGITHKSSYVNKFANISAVPVTAKVTPLEVRPVPSATRQHDAPTYQPVSRTSDLLERALEAAQGHKEPFYEHKKKLHHRLAKKIGVSARTVALATTVFVGLALGGLYAYQNVPRIAMKVAASRAGFGATMPNYNPSGFSFDGPVQYTDGQVTVGYKSNTDDREYKVTQQTSDWSSESLLNNYIVSNNKQYQTYQDKGRTIYIYDGVNATWVNGGIWYQIEGQSQLTTDQLVRIAASF